MMSGNTPNQEQIQIHISSAFDSVNLITNKITEPSGDQTKNIVLINSKSVIIVSFNFILLLLYEIGN